MFFFVRTVAPRPDFHLAMTPAEREVMRAHVSYWESWAARGVAVVYGPVLDVDGAYGVGVFEVDDAGVMQALLAEDPARDLLHPIATPMASVVLRDDPRDA